MEEATDIFELNVAYRLKLKRVQLRLTLGDVEAAIGMKGPFLSRFETGTNGFHIDTPRTLIEFYGLRVEDVFKTYTERPSRRDWSYLDALEREMLRCRKSKGYRKMRRAKQLVLEF